MKQVRGLMGEEAEIWIRLVDEIERNPRYGKFLEVMSRVQPADTKNTGAAPYRQAQAEIEAED